MWQKAGRSERLEEGVEPALVISQIPVWLNTPYFGSVGMLYIWGFIFFF